MINTTECESRKPPTPPHYPRLRRYRSVNGNYIVLFTSLTQGVIVSSQNPGHAIGSSSAHWTPERFEDFDGSVELENAS